MWKFYSADVLRDLIRDEEDEYASSTRDKVDNIKWRMGRCGGQVKWNIQLELTFDDLS